MNTTSTERQVRRQVIQSLPGFWGYAFLSAFIFLAIQLIALIPTVLMQRVIDQLIPERQIGQIVFTIILFCVIPLPPPSFPHFTATALPSFAANWGYSSPSAASKI